MYYEIVCIWYVSKCYVIYYVHVYDMLVNVNVIYYVHVCEQAPVQLAQAGIAL